MHSSLKDIYTLNYFIDDISTELKHTYGRLLTPFISSLSSQNVDSAIDFIGLAIYNYYVDDLIAYDTDVVFMQRLTYDIAVKFPYWYKKLDEYGVLYKDFNLMQTSKMTSSSTDKTNAVGGNLQKSASTPTGVDTSSEGDTMVVTETPVGSDQTEGVESDVSTESYVEKYTNYIGKNHSTTFAKGERSSEIFREGSIKDYIEVLEKLPSSFADEITKAVSKHFIFDYEGEELYD